MIFERQTLPSPTFGSLGISELFEELFALKVPDPLSRKELKEIRSEISEHVEKRDRFAHSRLLLPRENQEAVDQ